MILAADREPVHGLFVYGLVVICALAMADLLGLPGGASVGQVMMLAGMPFWANATLARTGGIFDPAGRAAAAVVLSSTLMIAFMALYSATYAAEPSRVARVILPMLSASAMFCFIAGTLTERRLALLLVTVSCAIGAISLLSALGYLNGTIGALIFAGTDRAHGTFKNPNQYGIVISTVAPVAAGLVMAVHGRLRLAAFASLILMLVGLLLSGSKTNLMLTGLSLSVFALLIVAASFKGIERVATLLKTVVGIALALAAAFAVLKVLNPRAVMLLGVFFDTDQSVPSLMSRQHLWDESFRLIGENPWSGVGAGQYLQISIDGDTISHSHNLFIEYARTLGVPGLALIAILVLTVMASLVVTVLGVFLRDAINPGLRAVLFGTALSCTNYVAANMTSESFGPSTIPFFWLSLFTFFAVRGRTMRLERPAAARGVRAVPV